MNVAEKLNETRGFTLVEITLVLGLTLGLAAALIFGLSAYQQGADRAKCLLVQANVQKAVRSYQNLNELSPGDPCSPAGIIWPASSSDTSTFLSSAPSCPSAKGASGTAVGSGTAADAYTVRGMKVMNTIPAVGEAFAACQTVTSGGYAHKPKTVDGTAPAP